MTEKVDGVQTQKDTSASDLITQVGDSNMLVDGPLSKAYSAALATIYAKEKDPKTGLALETQAIDALHSQMEMVEKEANQIFLDNKAQNLGLLFGVEKGKASQDDLIDVADTLSVMSPEQKKRSAVIFDAALTNENTGNVPKVKTLIENPFEAALESLCEKHGVQTYSSLKDFVKLHG